jgi:hypothetical protein
MANDSFGDFVVDDGSQPRRQASNPALTPTIAMIANHLLVRRTPTSMLRSVAYLESGVSQ